MSIVKKVENIDMREKISLLWIVVMFIMTFADIFTFMMPGFASDLMTGNTPIKITQELMLVMAIINTIPIGMIFLSRVLKYKANRWANIFAGAVTIVYVIGGGSAYLHYYYFEAVEILCMLGIIWYSWKWTIPIRVEDEKNESCCI